MPGLSKNAGTTNAAVTVSYEANSAASRGGAPLRLEITMVHVPLRHVEVTQAGSPTAPLPPVRTLSVSETALNLSPMMGSTPLMVSSNVPWIIEEDIAWLTPNKTSGTADATVDFSYEANTTEVARDGTITFKSSDGADVITHLVEVTQAGTSTDSNSGVLGVPLSSSQDVILYPNPVEDGVVSLDVSSLLYSSARVRIMDFSGAWHGRILFLILTSVFYDFVLI